MMFFNDLNLQLNKVPFFVMSQIYQRPAKPSNKGTKVLFQNPVIERLTRTHSSIPISIFLGCSAIMIYWALSNSLLEVTPLIGLFVFGLLLFTLIEYLVHRYLFHMITDTKFKERVQYMAHGVHHDFPKDKTRLAMPPIASVLIVAILFLVLRFFIGNAVFGFLPGFITGYSAYLFVHYMVHAYQPPKNIFKVLWINHGIHHYKDPERAFGVSSPLWDFIFRTLPR